MSAVLRVVPRIVCSEPIPAWHTLPEGPAHVFMATSTLQGLPSVHVMLERGVNLPPVGLHVTPHEAIHLAEELVRLAIEAGAAVG